MSDYTDKNFTISDWELIQDCIVNQISYLNSRQSCGPQYGRLHQVERLEALLEKARISRLAANKV